MGRMNDPRLRLIDHCVLPVADLDTARAWLTALGFTVAPEGRHPFGTKNACVYFGDDTFLEPLAIADTAEIATARREGNVFIERDALYRQTQGEDGFSALVFKSEDAEADHRTFEQAGISAGPMLSFSRPFVDASGASGTASFKLAFAAEPNEAAAYLFTCQRLGQPKVDRTALERHDNGALAIKAIIAEAGQREKGEAFVNRACPTPPGTIEVTASQQGSNLRFRGIVLGVSDLTRTEQLFSDRAINHSRSGNRILVPPAPGQGVQLVFEEA